MKRFILSAFSVLLAAGVVAPTAQAIPKVDPAFNIQTLRLNEFDVRNKSEESPAPYYLQPSAQPSAQSSLQNVTAAQDGIQTTDPTVWETPKSQLETQEEDASPVLSVIERRHQSLDRS